MTPLAYAKLGGIVFACLLLSGGGYHFGGLASKAALSAYQTAAEAQHAAQLSAVVKVLEDNARAAAADHAAQQKVIDAYDLEKSLPPITAGLVERMRLVEAASGGAGDCPVPGAGSVASGAQSAGGIPGGDSEGRRLLQAALDAAARDAKRLDAVRQLAPKPK